MKPLYAFYRVLVLGLIILSIGCREQQYSVSEDFKNQPPQNLKILNPDDERAWVVGDSTILDVITRVQKRYLNAEWPPSPDDITKIECAIENEVRIELQPEDTFKQFSWSYEVDPVFSQYYWYFRCSFREFGRPGHHKKLMVRVWRGTRHAETTAFLDYDNEELRRLAVRYIVEGFAGRVARFPSRRIYYYNEDPSIQDEIDEVLQEYMGPRFRLTFIPVNNPNIRPLIWFPKGECCAVLGGGEISPYNKYVLLVVRLGVDDDKATICHEVGHIFGLWHDDARWYDWPINCMSSGDVYEDQPYKDAVYLLHPYQQKAVQLIYSHPPGYDFRDDL